METIKYKVISTKSQYKKYCDILEELVLLGSKNRDVKDEIALLTVLIEKWDADQISRVKTDPVELLRSFMKDHDLKAKDLVDILNISKGYVSDILNYNKGLSKDVVRKLAIHFKVSQAAFNRPYKLRLQSPAA